jgi:KDO2-lipid IV(A) lauroyltransferase
MPRPPGRKRLKRALRFALLVPVLGPLGWLPRPPARALATFYGWIAYLAMPGLRARMLRNLEAAFPSWSAGRRKAVARQCLGWVGRCGADFLRLGGGRRAGLLARIRVDGGEHWEAADRSGRGTLVVSGHLGNWELLGAYLATGRRPVHVLHHPFEEARLDRLVGRIRERAGVHPIAARTSIAAGFRVLREGEILGILIDRVPRGSAVTCRFFGRECRTAPGAVRLALRSGALVIPAALWEDGRRGFRLRFWPPIETTDGSGGSERRIAELTRALTAKIEEMIREAPGQWPWFYDRWKIPKDGGPPVPRPAASRRDDLDRDPRAARPGDLDRLRA